MIIVSLRLKVILGVVILILLFGSIATWFVFTESSKRIIKREKETVNVSIIEQMHEVGQIFLKSSQLSKKIGDNEIFKNYLINQYNLSAQSEIELKSEDLTPSLQNKPDTGLYQKTRHQKLRHLPRIKVMQIILIIPYSIHITINTP